MQQIWLLIKDLLLSNKLNPKEEIRTEGMLFLMLQKTTVHFCQMP